MGERRYSSYLFSTSTLDGVNGQRHAPPPFIPGGRTPVPILQEAEWAPEPVWIKSLEEKSAASAEDRTSIA
jgi:hypothetical protein